MAKSTRVLNPQTVVLWQRGPVSCTCQHVARDQQHAHDRTEQDAEHRRRAADDECMQRLELEVESASGHGCLTAAFARGKRGELLTRLRLTGARAQACQELEDAGGQAVAAPDVAVLPPRVRYLPDPRRAAASGARVQRTPAARPRRYSRNRRARRGDQSPAGHRQRVCAMPYDRASRPRTARRRRIAYRVPRRLPAPRRSSATPTRLDLYRHVGRVEV